MNAESTLSASFLLRLWQVKMNGDHVWRASLESSQTGEKWGFADLDALFNFLCRRTALDGTQNPEPNIETYERSNP